MLFVRKDREIFFPVIFGFDNFRIMKSQIPPNTTITPTTLTTTTTQSSDSPKYDSTLLILGASFGLCTFLILAMIIYSKEAIIRSKLRNLFSFRKNKETYIIDDDGEAQSMETVDKDVFNENENKNEWRSVSLILKNSED
jgi:hypothetical protein